jgi:hypothetical protein
VTYYLSFHNRLSVLSFLFLNYLPCMVRHGLLMDFDFEYALLTRLFFLLVFQSLSLANDGIGTCTVSN